MRYLLVELMDGRVVSAYIYDDQEEVESMFISILMDYKILITDEILESCTVDLGDGYTIQIVEAEEL